MKSWWSRSKEAAILPAIWAMVRDSAAPERDIEKEPKKRGDVMSQRDTAPLLVTSRLERFSEDLHLTEPA